MDRRFCCQWTLWKTEGTLLSCYAFFCCLWSCGMTQLFGPLMSSGNNIGKSVLWRCWWRDKALYWAQCILNRNTLPISRGVWWWHSESATSENGARRLKMFTATSVMVLAPVGPEHEGQMWMRHEWRQWFCKNHQVTWEVAIFALMSRNCSSQLVKNARAFCAVKQFLNLCQDGGK